MAAILATGRGPALAQGAANVHWLRWTDFVPASDALLKGKIVQDAKKQLGITLKMETVNELFMRVTLTFGYMEQPNIPKALAICRKQGWKFDIMTTSFFLSRRSLKASPNSGMPVWQDRLFIGLARTAADATEYFQIPTGRVVEIGTQVTI